MIVKNLRMATIVLRPFPGVICPRIDEATSMITVFLIGDFKNYGEEIQYTLPTRVTMRIVRRLCVLELVFSASSLAMPSTWAAEPCRP